VVSKTLHFITCTSFYVFNVFFEIKKRDFLRFFASLNTFSQTMVTTTIRLLFDCLSKVIGVTVT